MTDADLARWEALMTTVADDVGPYGPLVREMGAAITALIGDTRLLQAEIRRRNEECDGCIRSNVARRCHTEMTTPTT